MVLQIRQSGDWQRLLDWLASRPEQASLMAEPMLLDGYLQALGETGNTLLMLREFDRISRQLASNLHTTPLSMIRAKVAAFCGDEETVSELLSRPLKSLSQEMCRYWLATALQAQGRIEEAESIFRTLAAIPDSPLARPAFNRIATPVSRFCPQQASSFDIEILSQLKTGLQTERRHRPAGAPSRRRTWVTWILAASLATVFLFEIPGGSEDIANLAELGALVVPVSITPGEHWRIFTAAFLHFGPIHLLLNVLALLFLGSWLERLWGPWLTLVSYLLSAFGSIGLAPFFMNDATFWNPAILLGASGGVMGLIGGLIVQTAFNWWNVRSALMAREFQLLATVIVLQVIFDQNSPNISSQAHLLGLAIGSLCGVAWNLFRLALHRPHAEA
jgi:rhomboid protease GluP